jgi:hypothetical protein
MAVQFLDSGRRILRRLRRVPSIVTCRVLVLIARVVGPSADLVGFRRVLHCLSGPHSDLKLSVIRLCAFFLLFPRLRRRSRGYSAASLRRDRLRLRPAAAVVNCSSRNNRRRSLFALYFSGDGGASPQRPRRRQTSERCRSDRRLGQHCQNEATTHQFEVVRLRFSRLSMTP